MPHELACDEDTRGINTKKSYSRNERRQEHNKFRIQEFKMHIKARLVDKPERQRQDGARNAKPCSGILETVHERRGAKSEITTYPNITEAVPTSKSAVESRRRIEASWRRISIGKGPSQTVLSEGSRARSPIGNRLAQGPLAGTREGLRKHHHGGNEGWSLVGVCRWMSGGHGQVLGKIEYQEVGDGGGKKTRGVSGGRAADKRFKVNPMFVPRKQMSFQLPKAVRRPHLQYLQAGASSLPSLLCIERASNLKKRWLNSEHVPVTRRGCHNVGRLGVEFITPCNEGFAAYLTDRLCREDAKTKDANTAKSFVQG
ncbi:hypothetical protein DFH06DRAFT_1135045 [Mycena polygramma]|nr:hypothetical protein DFH06DRAFT_1135045 [Mycena polygramma]